MAIRLRTVAGVRIAICAARSVPMPGDVYLDDADHYALTVKFSQDIEGRDSPHHIGIQARLMEQEESNNPSRVWWNNTYRGGPMPENTPAATDVTSVPVSFNRASFDYDAPAALAGWADRMAESYRPDGVPCGADELTYRAVAIMLRRLIAYEAEAQSRCAPQSVE